MSALAIVDLAVPFGAAAGLTGCSLDVAPGERVAIVGASGAGKTTLLRAIAGLAPVRAGHVLVGGRDVSGDPPERRGTAYLHQTPLLFPHLDVLENVAFPLRVRGVPAAQRRTEARELLAAVRLDGFDRRRPQQLSGGQRHRVALARAVAARPAALLLDEPLASLDPSLRAEVRDALLAIHAQYRPALLLVTHDLDEAAVLADRIGILLDGTLAQVDTPARLLTFPATPAIARFLGGFVELPGEVAGNVVMTALGPVRPAIMPPDAERVLVVVRADALVIGPPGAGADAVVEEVRALAGSVRLRLRAGPASLTVQVPLSQAPKPLARIGVRIAEGFAMAHPLQGT